MLFLAYLFLGCASEASDSSALPDAYVLTGGTVLGQGRADVEVADGRIVALGTGSPDRRADWTFLGRFLAPAFVDSHVHLAYLPRGGDARRRGRGRDRPRGAAPHAPGRSPKGPRWTARVR